MIELAKLTITKTHANPFHIIQYLEQLVAEKLMVYDHTIHKWQYDLQKIASDTNVSDNVAGILASKIDRLPSQVQSLLFVAAHLGYQFSKDILENAARAMQPEELAPSSLGSSKRAAAKTAK